MRLVHVSTVMAALSLAAAVLLYMRVDELAREMGSPRAQAPDARSPELAQGVHEGAYLSAPPSHPPAEARGSGVVADGPAVRAGSSTSSLALEERVQRLEESQRAMQAHAGPGWQRVDRAFAHSVDDLAQKLSLTPTQRAQMDDVVARGRQRIEDVLKIPDETGKSPYERRVEARQKLADAMKSPQTTGMFAMATDLFSYRNHKIPGRNETYGDEIDRVRKETKEEMSRVLDAKQQEDFSQMNVDPVLGEGGQVSIAYAIGDMGGASIVETQGQVVEDGEALAPDAPRFNR